MIIPAIAGWFKEKRKSFAEWRFEFGMLVTALVVGSYYYCKAIYKFLKLDKKDSPTEHLDRLLELGDRSIDIFLNQLQIMLPNKLRKLLMWEKGYP